MADEVDLEPLLSKIPDLKGIVNYLETYGYLNDYSNKAKIIVTLTPSGRRLIETKIINFKDFMIRSILVPIFVSAFTTGFIWLVTNILIPLLQN